MQSKQPLFTNEDEILNGEQEYGLLKIELSAGEIFYIPSLWHHEVHNLTSDSLALTNSTFNRFYTQFLSPSTAAGDFLNENKLSLLSL
jgi:oxalate decarboxylase/phosphoglucose isomerase-like protein (cupin superfamily)